MLRKSLWIALILTLLLVPFKVLAQDSCDTALKLCAVTVDKKNEVIKLSDLAIAEQKAIIVEQNKKLEFEKEKDSNVFRSPVLMVLLGIVAGVLISR